MAGEHVRETFAIVRTDESDLDVTQVARLIAEPLGIAVVDRVQGLAQRFGILAENLPEPIANRCIALLAEASIPVRMVPQSAIVELPEVVTLRSGRPDNDVFFYVGSQRKGAVKWTDLLWIDLVTVPETLTQEFDDWDLRGTVGASMMGGAPALWPKVRHFKNRRSVTKYPLFVDVVISEPWLLLRIPQERFEFAATGLPTFPTRRENLMALSATIASHATKARLGPGLKWIESGSPPREHRLGSQASYCGFLRWQLTRLALG